MGDTIHFINQSAPGEYRLNFGPNAVWDDTYKGYPAPSDVYINTIEMDEKVCDLMGIPAKRGDVTLVR